MQVQSLRVKLIIVPLRVVTGGWCVGVKRPDQKDLNDEWDSFEFFVEQVSHAEMDFWKWKALRSNATLSVWMIRAKNSENDSVLTQSKKRKRFDHPLVL